MICSLCTLYLNSKLWKKIQPLIWPNKGALLTRMSSEWFLLHMRTQLEYTGYRCINSN